MITKISWMLRSLIYKLTFKKFGNLSYIAKPTFLGKKRKISIGNKVRVFPHARLECINTSSGIFIEDNVSIGPNLNITSGGKIVIEKGVTISSNVFITDMDHSYDLIDMPIMQQGNKIKITHISENCFIGTGSVILAGTYLGKQCIVGANAVVRGAYGDYCVLAGNPARIVKKYNINNLKWERVIE